MLYLEHKLIHALGVAIHAEMRHGFKPTYVDSWQEILDKIEAGGKITFIKTEDENASPKSESE